MRNSKPALAVTDAHRRTLEHPFDVKLSFEASDEEKDGESIEIARSKTFEFRLSCAPDRQFLSSR